MLTNMSYGPWFTYISNTWKSIILSIFLISTMHILYSMQSREPLPSLQYRSLDIETIKDHLQPFFRPKVQYIQPIYMYISVRPKGHAFKQSHLWCFYSVHLKLLWNIPNSSRDLSNFRKYFLSEISQICLKRTKNRWFSTKNSFQKYNLSLKLLGIFQSGFRWTE